MQKKGLSPVIATILLISIALAIAVLIFMWARSFLNEQNTKFDEPIENACALVSFDVEVSVSSGSSGSIFADVTNRGDVPIYGLELRKRGATSIESSVGVAVPITGSKCTPGICNGESGRISYTDTGIVSKDKVVISPILMGTKGNQPTSHGCQGEEFEQEVTVL